MRAYFLTLSIAAGLLASARAQSDPATNAARASTPGAARPAAGRTTAKGPLPDPVLLDGSAQQPEKRPEYGMLGEFEIPGDDNSKSGKVGGQQNPNQPGGGGAQSPQQNQAQSQGGGQPGGMPQGAAGGGGSPPPQGQAGQQGGGGAAGGPPPANQNGQAGGGAAGQGDPNGKAEGVQVAELQGDGTAGPAGGAGGAAGDNVPKPQQVAIGDPTMQIKPVANAPGVVGQVSAGSTQQMESKIGKGGGGGGSPTSGGGGKGIEKGRTMPTGL